MPPTEPRSPVSRRNLGIVGVVALIAAGFVVDTGIRAREEQGSRLKQWTDDQAVPSVAVTLPSAKALSAMLRSRQDASKEVLSVSADVTNSGKVAAEEVVQLYVRLRGTSVAEPIRALKGFQRVTLGPGETKKVVFSLTPESFAIWDSNNEHNVEASRVNIWVSPDSSRGESAELEIRE